MCGCSEDRIAVRDFLESTPEASAPDRPIARAGLEIAQFRFFRQRYYRGRDEMRGENRLQGLPDQSELLFSAEAIEAAAFVLALRARGLRDKAVLGAMERVPRDLFAPRRFADLSRSDVALPLPLGQTMTAPGAVAVMLSALKVEQENRVLEIGTGSGYVSALLVRLGGKLVTVERYEALADGAVMRFSELGLAKDVQIRVGNGFKLGNIGRFDRILLNGALPAIPAAATSLLAPGGRLVGAVTVDGFPRLLEINRDEEGELHEEQGASLRISPLVP
jgi:protein-L-isoaspartate(D-aspartate) O-methyltransferase